MVRRAPLALFAALLAIYLLAAVSTTHRVTATGDEPYYFLAADSLLHGEGFELSRRWYWIPFADYAPGDFLPGDDFLRRVAPSRSRPGLYPLHDLGLSLLIAVPLALGGRALVVACVALAMAGAVALGHRLAIALGARPLGALAGALAAGLSAPAVTYSGQVFPDALAPLPVGLALCGTMGALPSRVVAPAIAALPFLHLRFWPLALGLLALHLALRRPPRRRALALLAPLAAVVLGLSALDLAVYGVPLPHAGFFLFFASPEAPPLSIYAPPSPLGLAGVFLDRAFGLLPAAPIELLLFVGAGVALRGSRAAGVVLATLPYLVFFSFVDWTGGYSPQARYLAPLAPLFVALLALVFARGWAIALAIPLALWTLAQSLVYVVAPWLRYDAYGQPPLADRAWSLLTGVTPSALFPLLGTEGATAALVLWSLVLGALVAAGYARARHAIVIGAPENPAA